MRKKSTILYFMMSILLVSGTMAGERVPVRRDRMKVQNAKAVTELSVPVLKEATEVTDAGFTANWETVENADGYATYAILKHKAVAEEDYYLANEDFQRVPQGTIDNPKEGGEFVILDEYTNRCDWQAIFPMYIDGAVGLDNTIADIVPGCLYSPYYDLSYDGGKVTLVVTMMSRVVGSVKVLLFDKDNKIVDEKTVTLTSDWKTSTIELANGTVDSYIGIVGNETDFDIFYIDDIKIYQHLKAGEITTLKYAYDETEKTSYNFLTPDKVVGDSYAFKVRAYNLGETEEDEVVLSDYSELKEVIDPNGIATVETHEVKVYMAEDLHIELAVPASVAIYTVGGVCVNALNAGVGDTEIRLKDKGIYIVKVGSQVFRVIK